MSAINMLRRRSYVGGVGFVFLVCLVAAVPIAQANVTVDATSSSEEEGGMRIVGGRSINITEARYLMQLKDRHGKFFCGGTLVSPLFVVTAAHCMIDYSAKNTIVVGGQTLISGGGGVVRKVKTIYTPSGYKPKQAHMDVAVLELFKPMIGENIVPVAMCKKPVPDNAQIDVTGWGRLEENAVTHSNELQFVQIPQVPMDVCKVNYKRSRTKLTRTMFCAGVPGSKDSCTGDSGGAALYDGDLCGIVSWGVGCGRIRRPGVYTSIPVVREFIDGAMKKSN